MSDKKEKMKNLREAHKFTLTEPERFFKHSEEDTKKLLERPNSKSSKSESSKDYFGVPTGGRGGETIGPRYWSDFHGGSRRKRKSARKHKSKQRKTRARRTKSRSHSS
jgi:hypothetical protein